MSEQNLLSETKPLLAMAVPADLGPGPRKGVEELAQLQSRLDRTLKEFRASVEQANLIRALIFLWHDHLEASHAISQNIATVDGSYVHGIMHRREPDYSNAKYWFHRVGDHRCFLPLAQRVTATLQAQGEGRLAARLAPGGKWDPVAFVDACAEAAGSSPTETTVTALRAVQAIEFEVLLEAFCDM